MAYSKKEIETIFNKILLEIEEGKAVINILKNKDYPSNRTFWKWLDQDEYKVKLYARACEARADAMVEDMIQIADDGLNDTYEDDEGNQRTDHDVIARSKLRVDTRKWLASKLKPKKYGDSSLLKIGDNEGGELKINAIFSKDIMNVPTNTGTKEDTEAN